MLYRFSTIVKNRDETFVLYSNRLKSLLLYYLESRKCKDFQTLIDLLVCDRIKQTLPESVLRYTLSLECNREGSWMPLKDLASNLDIYNDTHVSDRPRHVVGAMGGGNAWKPNAKVPPPRPPPPKLEVSQANTGKDQRSNSHTNGKAANVKRCFICNSPNHLANYHSRASATPSTAVKQSDC